MRAYVRTKCQLCMYWPTALECRLGPRPKGGRRDTAALLEGDMTEVFLIAFRVRKGRWNVANAREVRRLVFCRSTVDNGE